MRVDDPIGLNLKKRDQPGIQANQAFDGVQNESCLVPIGGGRNTIFLTTTLLILPAAVIHGLQGGSIYDELICGAMGLALLMSGRSLRATR